MIRSASFQVSPCRDSAVVLVRGTSSRAKRFRLVGLPAAAALARLAAA
jgi:uncharacterized protein YggU (UPF0235/DUF167 family)